MIKFIGTRDGKCIYGFGLSRANCDKLLAGKPIFVDLDVMGGTDPLPKHRGTVLIFAGEDDQAVVAMLNAKGVLKGTEIREEEGLDNQSGMPK